MPVQALQQAFCRPGHVVLLNGQLGAGKSTVARGFVRAFCRDLTLDVPSPTFLLCLSYQEDMAHEERTEEGARRDPLTVYHMDPYRLGKAAEKMAGLIDFDMAFASHVCLIEWPDQMPGSIMNRAALKGVNVQFSGAGIQAAGRLVSVSPLDEEAEVVLSEWRSALEPPSPPMHWQTGALEVG